MEEATHVALIIVAGETLWRTLKCNAILMTPDHQFRSGLLFFCTYLLCMAAIFMELKSMPFFKSAFVRGLITVLHAADGVSAVILGLAIYYQDSVLLIFGILAIGKIFLLHLLSRMVTGVKAYGNFEVAVQTTKTFLHHTGSFLFISNPTVALITALWRFTSMNGHAILSLKDHISRKLFDDSMWVLAHARNTMVVAVLLLCHFDSEIRRGFAVSAIGHIAYMIVRMGPVFRLGSLYLKDEKDKARWGALSDSARLRELFLELKYPFFALEIGLLFTASLYFAYLRATTAATFVEGECAFV